jgi:holo-[acyl-carrier protein] synthase
MEDAGANGVAGGGVLGLGLDLVEVRRIETVIEKQGHGFLRRVFTEREREYCGAKAQPAVFYAARFAAKEAVAKAFGTGIGAAIGWLDIEVSHNATGAPEIRFSAKGADLAESRKVARVLVSLTHTGGMAAASVVLIGK